MALLPEEIQFEILLRINRPSIRTLRLVSKWFARTAPKLVTNNHRFPWITDETLERLPNITQLNLYKNYLITDKGLQCLKNLTELVLFKNSLITDAGLMPTLRKLNLNNNNMVTDAGLQNCPKLSRLDLSRNFKITNEGIEHLRIIHLVLRCNHLISKLPHAVRRLDLQQNHTVTNEALPVGLTELNLSGNQIITDAGLSALTNLRILDLTRNTTITDRGLPPSLTKLNLTNTTTITDAKLLTMTNLKKLYVSFRRELTCDFMKLLDTRPEIF